MLYSGLLKRGTTYVSDENKCLIDTNELIARKLENYKNQASSGFRAGLQAQELEIAELPEGEETENVSAIFKAEPIYEGPSAEELIAEAQEQIAQMELEAKTALEVERRNVLESAKQEGYTQGYQEGQMQGMAQVEGMKKELAVEKKRLQDEYQQMVSDLEPELIDTLTGIYEHVFQVEMASQRDLIVYLLTAALSRIESARDFLVHISKEDYAYVSMRKREIQVNSMIGNANLEFIEDISLHKNECLIETEGGIFDCGLGTQLSELTRKLKLLSYEKD